MNMPFDIKKENTRMEFDIDSKFILPRPILKSLDRTHKTTVIESEKGHYTDGVSLEGVNKQFDINPEFVTPIHELMHEKCEEVVKALGKELNTDSIIHTEKNQDDYCSINEAQPPPFSISQAKVNIAKTSSAIKDSVNQIKHILEGNAERKKCNEENRQISINQKVLKSSIEDFIVRDLGGVFRVNKDNTYEEISTYHIEFISYIKRVEEHGMKMFLKILAKNNADELILTIGLNELENIADIVRDENPIFYVSFTSKNAVASFRQYVYKKYETMRLYLKIEVEYNCIGWTKDLEGKNIYVSHHLLECVSDNERKLEIIGNDEMNDILDWGINFLGIGQRIEHILPIWLYSFYGFSIPLLQEAGLQTQLVFMIRGRSGSLKTALGRVD